MLLSRMSGLGEGSMHGFDVNWLAVLAATAAKFVIGGLWYSPLMFGPRWAVIVGGPQEEFKARMPRAIAIDVAGGFVMAGVLANVLHFTGAVGLIPGVRVAFFMWLGFMAPPLLTTTVFEG